MKRTLLVVLLVVLSLAATTTIAYAADPEPEPEQQDGSGIDEVLGTLGLYASMMAVLAVGTEVVIDMVRPIFGLQRKMSTDEAFAKLKEQLPKTLEELGLSQETQDQLTKTIAGMEQTAKSFGADAEKVRTILYEEWPDILTDLATQSVDEVFEKHWGVLEKKLQSAVPSVPLNVVEAWLRGAISNARMTGTIDLQGPLTLINGVLEEIKIQQNRIQSPLRKLWRYFRDRLLTWATSLEEKVQWGWVVSFILRIPAYIEYGWARLRGSLEGGVEVKEGIKKLGKVAFDPARSLQEAARRVLEEDIQQGLREEKRVKWLRIISVIVGIILAAILSLDSFQLLEPVLSSAANTFHASPSAGESLKPEDWYNLEQIIERADKNPNNNSFDPQCAFGILSPALKPLFNLTPGIILSGLGAAAGSAFWHDVLDKLRTTKQVSEMVKKAKKTLSGENEGG
ncbi:MAG: hypothetical protein AB8I69_05630 [Anaerolineae bacterium]